MSLLNGNMFEPDVVLPQQFFATLRRRAPDKGGEFQLVTAVLEDAVHCFQKYAFATDRRGCRLFEEAREWLMDECGGAGAEGEQAAFSFLYVCEVLGLDPNAVRWGLRRWREKEMPLHACHGVGVPLKHGRLDKPVVLLRAAAAGG